MSKGRHGSPVLGTLDPDLAGMELSRLSADDPLPANPARPPGSGSTTSRGRRQHGRYPTNVWDYAGVNTLKRERMEELAMPPTVKPVAILDVSKRGNVILDPFCGCGTRSSRPRRRAVMRARLSLNRGRLRQQAVLPTRCPRDGKPRR